MMPHPQATNRYFGVAELAGSAHKTFDPYYMFVLGIGRRGGALSCTGGVVYAMYIHVCTQSCLDIPDPNSSLCC